MYFEHRKEEDIPMKLTGYNRYFGVQKKRYNIDRSKKKLCIYVELD